ncbi:MAG TPA: tetratricopeptide repeat protein [Kofleriaceae bacterium]|nr:tetratricopeptide repeat protein [Kofleriaceae bacterium]
MAPLVKDGIASSESSARLALATEPIELFDAGELFGDGEHEKTVVTAMPYELRPRFTGRRVAVEALKTAFEKVLAERALSFAVLVGEPGMGKSRLVGELAKLAKGRASMWTGGADEQTPYGAIARLLGARFGLIAGEPEGESRDRIQAGVAEVLPAQRVTEVAHLLAHLLRVPFEDSPVVGPLAESPQQLETRTFLALRRFLAADAARQPLVLVLENVELAGPETINLIQYLAVGLASEPVMIVATATSSLFEKHPSFGEGEVAPLKLELGALTPVEAEALLKELLAPLGQLPERIATHARALGGSPRAIHELVRLLLESECIVRGDGMSWKLDAVRLTAQNLPRSYEELVRARLAVMDPAERRILEMAAVIGEACWLDAIVALDRVETVVTPDPDGPTLAQIAASGDHSRLAVVAALGKLVEREWVVEEKTSSVPGEREFHFAYPNLHAMVYRAIDDARRRRYHATIARWLEMRPDGRAAAAQEDVARHLEQGGLAHEAALRYRRAADQARATFMNERAIRLYDRALACMGDGDVATRIHLWHDLGSVYEMIGDFEAALGAFERMLRLSWVVASKTKAAVAFNKMGRVWRRKGDLRLALEYLERGLELFRGSADARGIAGSLDDIGRVLAMLGRYDEAFAKITEALARRGKGGDKRSIAASLSNLGSLQYSRGQFEAARTCHKEALELRAAAGDRLGVTISENNLAVLAFELGEKAEARALWTKGLSEAEAIGALPMSALILTNLGELALDEQKLEEAQRRLEDAIEIIEDIEDRQLEAEASRHMALVAASSGNGERARELCERAVAIAQKAGLREMEALSLLTTAQVLSTSLYDADRTVVTSAGASPAMQYFEKAIEMLRAIGNDAELAKALEAFGKFKIESHDYGGGKDLLREALVTFTRLGMKRAQDVEVVISAI